MIAPFNFALNASKLSPGGPALVAPFILDDHIRQLRTAGQSETTIQVVRRNIEKQPEGLQPASRSMPSLLTSTKMGNRRHSPGSDLELKQQLSLEADDETAGYVSHPEGFSISWINLDGSPAGKFHKPDLLKLHPVPPVPTAEWIPAEFQEVKHTDELETQRKHGSGLYIFDEATATWRCPSAEKAAREVYGFGYRVIVQLDINQQLASNVDHVWDFIRKPLKVPNEVIEEVREHVASNQGITMANLLPEVNGLTVDRFLAMIVSGHIYVPLDELDLRAVTKVRVYTDRVLAAAHKAILRTESNEYLVMRPPLFQTGEQVQIDQITYEALLPDGDVIRLRDEVAGIKPFRRSDLLALHREGRLKSLGVPSEKEQRIRNILNDCTPQQLVDAMRRLERFEAYITTDKRRAAPGEKPLSALDRFWLNRARVAKKEHGLPLLGCIDRIRHRGGRETVLTEAQEEAIADAIKQFWLIPGGHFKSGVYNSYKTLCLSFKFKPVSSKTFYKRLNKIPPHVVAQAQEGGMSANQHTPPVTDSLSLVADPKYFMHVVHLDEFVLDLATVDPELGRYLGQLNVVAMLDGYTRTVLAFLVTFEDPSYASTTLPVLRKCIQRWKRCPAVILTDRGPAFKKDYAAGAVALGVRPTWRPAGYARGGAQQERMGGVTNQRFAKGLRGYTGIFAKYRRVSQTHNPALLAVYGTDKINEGLEKYYYEEYDELPHGGLNGRCPRAMREHSLENHGRREHVEIERDSVLEILSLPGPHGDGTAKIQEHDGVQHDGLYYWHRKFGEAEHIGTRVQMRWDPVDITRVFAHVGGCWVECVCLKLRDLRRLTREQLCQASIMIRGERKKYRRTGPESIAQIQEFLNKVRKTNDEVQDFLRVQHSARQACKAFPVVCLETETATPGAPVALPTVVTEKPATAVDEMPGFPKSYLEEDAPE